MTLCGNKLNMTERHYEQEREIVWGRVGPGSAVYRKVSRALSPALFIFEGGIPREMQSVIEHEVRNATEQLPGHRSHLSFIRSHLLAVYELTADRVTAQLHQALGSGGRRGVLNSNNGEMYRAVKRVSAGRQ